MYKCTWCKRTFDKPYVVVEDNEHYKDGKYRMKVCPHCTDDDIEEIEEEEDEE